MVTNNDPIQLDLTHKHSWQLLASEAIKDTELLNKLVVMMISKDEQTGRRTAEVIRYVSDYKRSALDPFLHQFVDFLRQSPKPNDATLRSILRHFQYVLPPENERAFLFDYCFQKVEDGGQAVAIRIFAMTAMYSICKSEPELLSELDELIEQMLSIGQSAGFQNRAAKILGRTWK